MKKAELTLSFQPPLTQEVIDYLFKPAPLNDLIKIKLEKLERERLRSEWTTPSSMLNIYLSNAVISNYSLPSFRAEFDIFLQGFKELLKPYIEGEFNVNDVFKDSSRAMSVLSSFYKAKGKNFHFIFTIEGATQNYIIAITKAIELIIELKQNPQSDLNLQIEKAYSQKNKKKYFIYDNNTSSWDVINPLVEIGNEIFSKISGRFDLRQMKPTPIINEDNFSNLIQSLPSNWVIDSDGFNIGMDIPNDVALYSSLCLKSLSKARKFLNKKIPNLKKGYTDYFIRSEVELSEFYDYFEDIIAAAIFAYTALEAFANICIPWNFKITEIDRKTSLPIIYSKADIEYKFPLRKKLKEVLKVILNTSHPEKENWWGHFINLEKLRNEIIHTKQVESKVKYTKLLSSKTFEDIESHREVIGFYGDFIALYRARLLEEYPFGFGHDSIIPALTTAKGYIDWQKAL
jgi:hypothetical protein